MHGLDGEEESRYLSRYLRNLSRNSKVSSCFGGRRFVPETLYVVYVHRNFLEGFDWELLCAYKSLKKAIEYASKLSDGRGVEYQHKQGFGCYFDQRLKRRHRMASRMTKVKVDGARYFPAFEMYPKASAERAVLYLYPDVRRETPDFVPRLTFLGVYSRVEDAVLEGWKRGNGERTRSAHTYGRGLQFDQGDFFDQDTRIGVDQVAFTSASEFT